MELGATAIWQNWMQCWLGWTCDINIWGTSITNVKLTGRILRGSCPAPQFGGASSCVGCSRTRFARCHMIAISGFFVQKRIPLSFGQSAYTIRTNHRPLGGRVWRMWQMWCQASRRIQSDRKPLCCQSCLDSTAPSTPLKEKCHAQLLYLAVGLSP